MGGGRAFVDITMSLDGFITGPNDSVEAPLGEGGDLGTEQIELEGTRVLDSHDVTHLQFRPPKNEGGAS